MNKAFTVNRTAKLLVGSDLDTLIDLGEAVGTTVVLTNAGATPAAAIEAQFVGATTGSNAATHTAGAIDTAGVANTGSEPPRGADAPVSVGQDADVFLAGATAVTNAATADTVIPEEHSAESTVIVARSGAVTFDVDPAIPLVTPNLPELPPAPLLAATDVETGRLQPAQVFELYVRPNGHDKQPSDVDTIPMPEPPLAFERPTDNIMMWADCADRPTLPGSKVVAGAFNSEALEAEVFEVTPADESADALTVETGQRAIWHDTGNWMLE